MTSSECIFCKVIVQELPAQIIEENDHVMVIKDIAPKAPVHYLILPKKHVRNVASLESFDEDVPSHIFLMAKQLSQKLPEGAGFRLIFNNGAQVGQSVFHLHGHFLSGKKMSDF